MLTICLATIPPRYPLLRRVLSGLLAQALPAEQIIVSWCPTYDRFGHADPPDVPKGVVLNAVPDHGPLTKLSPLPDLDGHVVWCDDDCLYGPIWLAALVGEGLGERAVASSTFPVRRLNRDGKQLIAQGFGGVLAPVASLRGLWPAPEGARWADDIWISGVLAANDTAIVTCPKARRAVTPIAAPAALQDMTDRKAANQNAADAVMSRFGLWSKLP